jgi:hypothetical protein
LSVRRFPSGALALVVPLLLLEPVLSGTPTVGRLYPNPVIGVAPGGVSVGDFNGDGRPDLAITDWNNGEVLVELGHGDATFAPGRRFPVGTAPTQLLAKDFNADGRQDLVVLNKNQQVCCNGTPGSISILLGLGDGSFAPQTLLVVGPRPRSMTAGDFNGDGIQDLAVLAACSSGNCTSAGEISVFIGVGDGSFVSTPPIHGGNEPISIACGDFDGDGRLDLIIGNTQVDYLQGSSALSLFPGMGDGTFGPETQTGTPLSSAGWLAVGDFNSDGRPDVAVTHGNSISVYIGHGDGTFQESFKTAGRSVLAIAIGDFNGDGHEDVATANLRSDDVSTFLGYGDGAFGDAQSIPAGNSPVALAFGDVDLDGRSDLLVANGDSETVLIRLGNGDGSFGTLARQLDHFEPQGVGVADFDRDGRLDLVVPYGPYSPPPAPGNLSLLLGNGDGSFGPEQPLGDNIARGSVVTGDFNADGMPDFAATNRERGSISVFLGRGDGTFGPETLFPVGYDPSQLTAGDINGDGMPDIVVVNRTDYYPAVTGDLSLLIGRGDGTFAAEIRMAAGSSPASATIADYDGDGHADLVVVNEGIFDILGSGVGFVVLFQGHGDGSFTPGPRLDAGLAPYQSIVSDFDGDGHPDLAVNNRGTNGYCDFCGGDLSLFFGNGAGTFGPQVHQSAGGSPLLLTAADIDHDGKVDLVTANSSFDISVMLSQGDRTFADPARFGVMGYPVALTVADFDGDGLIDLAGIGFEALTVLPHQPPPDRDGDGVLNAEDNCPTIPNPGQEDADGDHLGDVCDNCPAAANPGQEDADRDGSGDACDPCTDLDHDGFGNPGFPAATCPVDNCPAIANPSQADRDRDGVGDACDSCTDSDGDGYADPGFHGSCPQDNCSLVPNPSQHDSDADGVGDACDNCAAVANRDQTDRDGDGLGDVCDNCPATANPGQEDGNADGSGDACQPVVVIQGIEPAGVDDLRLRLTASDPQNEPLSGSFAFVTTVASAVTMRDALQTFDCAAAYLPQGVPGEGIGFANASVDGPYLFDIDGILGCQDFSADYKLAFGSCDRPLGAFSGALSLAGVPPPFTACVRPVADDRGGDDWTILSIEPGSIDLRIVRTDTSLTVPFTSGLPASVDISALRPDAAYRLDLTVTDGNTRPVSATANFIHQVERVMTVLSGVAPHAVALAPGVTECTGAGGGDVRLDGSASTDADSTPGTQDDIALYEWYEDYGGPGQQHLGTGAFLDVTLPLGTHALTLKVSDRAGESDTAAVTVTVRDMQAPTLTVHADPSTLWPPNHGMVPVHLVLMAADRCTPEPGVTLVSVESSELDDAPGNDDGATTGDIQGVEPGTADGDVLLRSERNGKGAGRVYTLTYRATDAAGNTTPGLATVVVPHDLGMGPEPLLMRLEPDGTPGMVRLFWPATPEATGYDVIAGELSQARVVNDRLWLGTVRVLARGTTGTLLSEGATGQIPTTNSALIYFIQPRTDRGGAGYGTESAPWPRVPDVCDGGCP